MNRIAIASALAFALAALPSLANEELAKKSGCLACHGIDTSIVGPSYKVVAAKYRTDKDAAAKLFKKVKEGGAGVWGQVPMPPNSTVTDEDIKTLVKWVLSQK
jgi:cytochrome c